MRTYMLMILAIVVGYNIASVLPLVPKSVGPMVFGSIVGLSVGALIIAVTQILRGKW